MTRLKPFTPSIRTRLLRRLARPAIRALGPFMTPRTNARGDVLDAEVEAMLSLQGTASLGGADVATRRRTMEEGCFIGGARAPQLPTIHEEIAGCRVRTYEVADATHAMVYLHGGGWVVGSLDSTDPLCRKLAHTTGRTIISVDYPLAPEHPWPAAVHAIEAVWRALDRSCWKGVAIGGDSAGGNLAAAVSRIVDGVELQFLLYPGLDATRDHPSHPEFRDQRLVLEGAAIDLYLELYAPEFLDPLASPLLAPSLDGLPPAVIAVGGFDPLRDEGLRYAERLQEAGIPVQLFDFKSLPHGFGNYDGLVEAGAAAMEELGRAMRPSE